LTDRNSTPTVPVFDGRLSAGLAVLAMALPKPVML
jgi:hypothetical protein